MIIEGTDGQFMVIIEKGKKLVETLTKVATDLKLKGGRISGIGAVEQVELGYYDLHEKVYIRKTFDEGDFELISLNGNISLKNGEPYIHVHAVTAEVHILPLGVLPERKPDQKIGLDLICGINS